MLRRGGRIGVVWLAAALPAAAEVSVRQVGDRLSVQATAAPVSEVLDQLARQTGMQLVYEGAPPRVPITLSIERQTPAEAVFSLLEGLGLNYALRLDEGGGRVLTLVMAGAAGSGGPSKPAVPAPPEFQPQPDMYPQPYPEEPPPEEYIDPNAGVIPPPPPQQPHEFVINPPQPPSEEGRPVEPSTYSTPTLGAGFSSPFNSSGFSTPPIIGNQPLPSGPPKQESQAPPGEPPPEKKEE